MDGEVGTESGLQRVDCELCGENLGYQGVDVPILREEWRHKRCPQRLAESFGITRDEVAELTRVITVGVAMSFPDFPKNMLGDPADESVRAMRAKIAAETALELLAGTGYEIRPGT